MRRGHNAKRRALGPPAAERSDADLVRALADGQLDELGALFDRYHASVRRYLARMGTPASEIDDLVQSTFLELVRAAPRFDPNRAAARTWLFGIATMMLRRQRRSVASALARAAQWVGFSQPDPVTPSEQFEKDEMARRLANALAQMSAKKREAFILVTIEGFSGEEAARILEIPVKTIWTRLHHARRELHRALGDDEGGDP
jgi:RNA polymerase sigma-70 factor (ECF subfamily)